MQAAAYGRGYHKTAGSGTDTGVIIAGGGDARPNQHKAGSDGIRADTRF